MPHKMFGLGQSITSRPPTNCSTPRPCQPAPDFIAFQEHTLKTPLRNFHKSPCAPLSYTIDNLCSSPTHTATSGSRTGQLNANSPPSPVANFIGIHKVVSCLVVHNSRDTPIVLCADSIRLSTHPADCLSRFITETCVSSSTSIRAIYIESLVYTPSNLCLASYRENPKTPAEPHWGKTLLHLSCQYKACEVVSIFSTFPNTRFPCLISPRLNAS
jgi:hypothetical protein